MQFRPAFPALDGQARIAVVHEDVPPNDVGARGHVGGLFVARHAAPALDADHDDAGHAIVVTEVMGDRAVGRVGDVDASAGVFIAEVVPDDCPLADLVHDAHAVAEAAAVLDGHTEFEPSNQMPGSRSSLAVQPLMTVSLEKFFMPPACQAALQRRRLLKPTSQRTTRWPRLKVLIPVLPL